VNTSDIGPPAQGGLPRASGGLARRACARARKAGVVLEPLLEKARLTLPQIDDSSVPLPVRDQIRLLNLVAEALDDEQLGFHVALDSEMRELGLLYYVITSSATLGEALRRGARYSSLVNEGVIQRCVVGEGFGMSLEYVGVSRRFDRHQAEAWMTLIVRIIRQLSGQRVTPVGVSFVHSRKSVPTELAAFFGCELEFGAAVDELTLARSLAEAPVVSADAYLNQLLVRYSEEALAHRRPARGSFATAVENAIVPLLPHAEVRAGDVARRLGISQRTLARRLNAEGQSFSTLQDRLKLDLAKRYLADEELSISHIAWLLGYQEASAFSKAFKRWTGKTPREERAESVSSAIFEPKRLLL
jgi:AraC-like DNA-binding protein